MKNFLKFFLVGIFFGIVLVKSEAVSWYRIYEMFKFQSFHMYGIIGTAVFTGIILLLIAKKKHLKTTQGTYLRVPLKDKGLIRYIAGGSIFGLGWALCGACPGPMYILVGTGVFSILIVIAAALVGTFVYGLLKRKLLH
ncbi:MAG: transporter [Winogradskyella sp.]|nr:transporter [Winogradskyella sp.]|tara:strand:+ start:1329 stop:1745 length:417 start_codon:yes stop_codon:yes gene_type:complete